jgi:arylsulfatase A-like enzyme
MELEEVTIAEILKTAGYTCCHIGKWHLGHDAWYPQKQGFDFNIAGCHFGMPPSYFDPYRKRKNKRGIPTLKPRREGEYLTDREADEAVNFIRQQKDRPFFLYMAHYAVHTPIQAKEEITSRYRTKPRYGQKSARYAAMIQSVDEAVGRIMSALEETKAADRTVIIFTSDNGGLSRFTNNAPLRAGKGWPYEGGIRVPLIIRCPGVVKPGTVSHEPVTSVDYLPTICRLAGAKPPAERQIDGLPLVDHLKSGGTTKLPREAIFWHFPHYRDDIVPYSIVRDGRWKLIRHYEGKTFELFDLEDDISETNDLSKKMAEKVAQLDAKLTGWLKEVGAKLPRPKPGPTSAK